MKLFGWFEEDFAKGRTWLRGLSVSQPRRETTPESLAPSELEERPIAVHALHAQVAGLPREVGAAI